MAEPTQSLPQSFESALAELEATVARMESGQLTLQESLDAYRRGAELLRYCQTSLREVEQQVKILEDGLLQDFKGAESS